MEKIILIIIGLIIATVGVVCIFDARIITKKVQAYKKSVLFLFIVFLN